MFTLEQKLPAGSTLAPCWRRHVVPKPGGKGSLSALFAKVGASKMAAPPAQPPLPEPTGRLHATMGSDDDVVVEIKVDTVAVCAAAREAIPPPNLPALNLLGNEASCQLPPPKRQQTTPHKIVTLSPAKLRAAGVQDLRAFFSSKSPKKEA